MDATPLTVGQELWLCAQLNYGLKAVKNTLAHLSEVALGGTAVGTGLNTPLVMMLQLQNTLLNHRTSFCNGRK
jgi:fumarate hydratase class II